MPKLAMWSVFNGVMGCRERSPDAYTAPEMITHHLSGIVSEDELCRFSDGERIFTTSIKGKREGKVVTASGTLYDLMDPEDNYEAMFPDSKKRLMENLPEI